MSATIRGGDNLRRFLRDGPKVDVDRVEVGFYAEDEVHGRPADLVGKLHEFGTRDGKTKESGFLRKAAAAESVRADVQANANLARVSSDGLTIHLGKWAKAVGDAIRRRVQDGVPRDTGKLADAVRVKVVERDT